MNTAHDILCIGSVLWDIIARTNQPMHLGSDEPGRITRLAGGVAMNIAMTAQRFGLRPTLLSAIGCDPEGEELLLKCVNLGMETRYIYRPSDHSTDVYMAIESPNGLVAAVADAHTLEAAADHILTPLEDGRIGSATAPYTGVIALDGNLTRDLLADIANRASFTKADLRVAPASPGKARRLFPLMTHPKATIYVNREEAGYLAEADFSTAQAAAKGLLEKGANRVIVTDGNKNAADGSQIHGIIEAPCPQVHAKRITGAGDTFMAAHIAAELAGKPLLDALVQAQNSAARYVSGEDL